jgi:hypothetical protein
MDKLIKDTIGKIKSQHIVPESKWKHLIRKYGIWTLFGLAILLGGASVSAAWDLLVSLDWDLYRFMHQNFFSYSLSIFPYFWTSIVALFIVLAFIDIRNTETGYRFSWLKMSLATLGGIVILGALMSFFGWGKNVNGYMSKGIPYYGQHMMVTRETQWSKPEDGFLSGTILEKSASELSLQDLQGRTWAIALDEKTLIRPKADVSVGQMIKIIGTKTAQNSFQSIEIRPWNGMGRGMMSGNGPQSNYDGQNMMNSGSGQGNRAGMMR